MVIPPPPHSPRAEDLLEHLGFVQSLARALVSDPAVADDVAQETLLAAIERPSAPKRGLRAWLRGVVWRRIQLHYRAEGRRERHEGFLGRDLRSAEEQKEHVVEEALQRAEQSRFLIQALADLPERYRSVIVLRYMDGLMPGRIAERLVMPVATVHTRLQRGLAALRRRLDRESGGHRTAWIPAYALLFRACPRPWLAPRPAFAFSLAELTLTAALIAAFPVAWFLLGNRASEAPRVTGSTPMRNAGHVLPLGEVRRIPGTAVLLTPVVVPGTERSPVGVEDARLRSERTATVRVVDGRTGLALAGVSFLPAEEEKADSRSFRFFREDPYLARTPAPTAKAWVSNAHGEAQVPVPVDGAARIDAVLPGYVPARGVVLGADRSRPTVVVLERAAALRLVRGGQHAGDILRVRLYSRARHSRSGWLTMEASGSDLVLDSLPPDRYEIAAVAHGAQPSEDPSLLGVFGTFTGVDASLGGRVCRREALLVAGAETSLTLFAGDGVGVHVRLVGATPPPAGTCVVLHTLATPTLPTAVAEPTAEGGRFAAIRPGTYELTALQNGDTFLRRRVTIPDQEAPFTLELPLWSGALDVSVATNADHGVPPTLLLHGPLDHGFVPPMSTERYGSKVRFGSLPPGRYELWTLTDRSISRTVAIGTKLETLRIDPALGSTRSVSILGPRGLEPGAVEPYLFTERGLWIVGDEESDGGFAVAPGRYHLLARGPGSELWFEEVDLSEDSTVDLEHSELVEVRLHLTFLDRPVASTPVAIAPVDVDASEDWFMSDLVTSPDGVLDLRLPSGRYRIWTPQSLAAEVEIPTGGGLRFVALGSP